MFDALPSLLGDVAVAADGLSPLLRIAIGVALVVASVACVFGAKLWASSAKTSTLARYLQRYGVVLLSALGVAISRKRARFMEMIADGNFDSAERKEMLVDVVDIFKDQVGQSGLADLQGVFKIASDGLDTFLTGWASNLLDQHVATVQAGLPNPPKP
jgi:hypothetical protein